MKAPYSLFRNLVDFMFPAVCHVCGIKLAPHERFVCSHCLNALPRTGYHGKPRNPMEERFAGIFPFSKASGHFFYTRGSAFSSLIQDMKYRGFPSIGNMLGEVAAAELYSTGFFADCDIIIPVPMHFIKQARRGYNQVCRIAEGISSVTDIPVSSALKAVKGHKTQTALSKEQRLENTAGLFRVIDESQIRDKGILLVDDICTTGATLISAAEAVCKAAPKSLTLFTLGVTF